MSNRYLYKAKRKDNGEWVEGAYYIEPYTDKYFIIQWNSTGLGFNEFIEVDGASVCQCTGIKDKNGKLIWENDIVCVRHTDGQENYQENIKVSYTKHGFSPFSWEYDCDGCDIRCEILDIKTIGNIFDEGSENIGKGAEEN